MKDINTLIVQLEKAYGKYNDFWKDAIKQFFTKSIKPEMYGRVYAVILSNHLLRSGTPCIASIKLCIKKAMETGELNNPYVTKAIKTMIYDYENHEDFKGLTLEKRKENIEKFGGLMANVIKKAKGYTNE